MSYKELLLFVILLSGTIYNFDNPYMRLIWIFLWIFLPIVGLYFSNQKKIPIKEKKDFLFALSIILLLMFTFFKNMNSLDFGISGSQSEKMTPFLFVFHVVALYYFYQVGSFNKNFIYKFYLFILFIIIMDMLIRYVDNPGLFLNYHHRQSAKNLGFFNNTNIEGAFIAFLLVVSWQIKYKYQKLIEWLMFVVLITTMARSAILSVIAVYIFQYMFNNPSLYKKIISLLVALVFIVFLVIDPLDLKNDGSLWSKIEFLQRMWYLIENGSLMDNIFGYSASLKGVIAVLDIDGHSPHVSIVKSFLYYGLIGVSIWFLTLYYFVKSNSKMFLPILNYFLFSLAGAPIFWPTLSVGLIIILIYEKIKKESMYVYK